MAWRRYLGIEDVITDQQIHDIGKLCFAFTAFWGYLTFGQYLVIWYGNIGEQTFFMRLRLIHPWKVITVASIWLVFVLRRSSACSRRPPRCTCPRTILFATVSLVGLWLMRYIEVYPSRYGVAAAAPFGIWEIGCRRPVPRRSGGCATRSSWTPSRACASRP